MINFGFDRLQANDFDPRRTVIVAYLKTFIFTLVIPCSVTIWIPYRLLATTADAGSESPGFLHWLGVVPMIFGAGVYLWCAWDFSSLGRGTPAPIDPPKVLVVRGLYTYVRNPMYVGVLSVLIGESLYFRSWVLLGWAAVAFSAFSSFIIFYEEPKLKGLFGDSNDRYLETVPRWLPILKKAGKRD